VRIILFFTFLTNDWGYLLKIIQILLVIQQVRCSSLTVDKVTPTLKCRLADIFNPVEQ
jgi:hypothetical protein